MMILMAIQMTMRLQSNFPRVNLTAKTMTLRRTANDMPK
jgi:hypothetical protein